MKASMRDSNGSVSFLIPQPFGLPKTDEFVRGGTAAFVNILCNAKICGDNGLGTFPINKVMFRQQLTGNGMLSVGKALYHEGFRLLLAYSCCLTCRYRGVGAPIMQKTLSTSLMFGTYDFYRHGILSAQKSFTGYVYSPPFTKAPIPAKPSGFAWQLPLFQVSPKLF